VRGVETLQKAVDRYSQAGGQTRSETWRQLGTVGELRSIDPALSILSSTRLRPPAVATQARDRNST
jgi:hypothetical protein